jgi:hypothetical protein
MSALIATAYRKIIADSIGISVDPFHRNLSIHLTEKFAALIYGQGSAVISVRMSLLINLSRKQCE